MKTLKNIVATFGVIAVSFLQPVQAEAIEQPVQLLERTSTEVIKILRDDHELLKKEPERIYKIVDDYILPHLDDVTMAKLALGKILMCSIINWLVCSLKAVIKAKRALVPPTSATKMGSNWAEAFGLIVLSLLLSDSCLLFYNGVPLLFIL